MRIELVFSFLCHILDLSFKITCVLQVWLVIWFFTFRNMLVSLHLTKLINGATKFKLIGWFFTQSWYRLDRLMNLRGGREELILKCRGIIGLKWGKNCRRWGWKWSWVWTCIYRRSSIARVWLRLLEIGIFKSYNHKATRWIFKYCNWK